MGRQVRRVPLGFDWPISKVWAGFLRPDMYDENPCPDCDGGWSARYKELQQRWYGYTPFDPATTGSKPWTPDEPRVWEFAERNVRHSPEFYGPPTDTNIRREALRLCRECWNGWSHHLSQEDVDTLVEAGRLMDFTHTFTAGDGWVKKDPPPRVTAAEVNLWSIGFGLGHDSSNCYIVCKSHCEREGVPYTCLTCDGHGSHERWPGQRAEGEAWVPVDPPTGDGWQLWETVSEGSPISPVFDTAEGLAAWMSSPAYKWGISGPMEYDAALRFVAGDGWAPSMVFSAGTGLVSGEQWIAGES